MRDNRLIRKEKYLHPDHIPENLTDKEDEVREIRSLLLPVNRRSNPLLVYGPPGTGKTVTVRKVLQDMEREASARTVYVDCMEYRTKTAILVKMLIDLGVPVPRKGKPIDVIYEKVERCVRNKNIVLAMDGIGFPEIKRGDILHTLAELSWKGLDLILVTRRLEHLEDMDESTVERLTPVLIHFRHYTSDEIFNILKERADKAFKPGAVPEESLKKIAEIVSTTTSSCTLAFALLYTVSNIAQNRNMDSVTEDLVEEIGNKFNLYLG
ncbi:MAG: AAA family ATPase [Archaeoglobaceae archaeon]